MFGDSARRPVSSLVFTVHTKHVECRGRKPPPNVITRSTNGRLFRSLRKSLAPRLRTTPRRRPFKAARRVIRHDTTRHVTPRRFDNTNTSYLPSMLSTIRCNNTSRKLDRRLLSHDDNVVVTPIKTCRYEINCRSCYRRHAVGFFFFFYFSCHLTPSSDALFPRLQRVDNDQYCPAVKNRTDRFVCENRLL